MTLVLMASWFSLMDYGENIEYLELYAGKARLTRLARALGYVGHAHDINFDTAFDVNSDSGFLSLG